MKLKEIDYKLLNYLYHNHNEPTSKIAKSTKISRDKVEYRLNKYLNLGLIKKFIPIINYQAIGYNKQVIIFLKFEIEKQAKEFSKELKNNKHCISYGVILEKFDIYINGIFKNNQELEEFITEIINKKEYQLEDYLIIDPYFAELYPLKFLNKQTKENYKLKGNTNKHELDKLDLNILREISKNGRIKLLDLSLKLKTNNTTIFYRLKKLKGKKIILGNRIQFDHKQIGYNYTVALINFKEQDVKEKIKQFARSSKKTNSLILNLHKPNAIIQFFYKEEQELRTEILKLKKILENNKIDLEIIHINEEEYINTIPF